MAAALYIYLMLINVITLVCFGIDKRKAITHSRRISEHRLLSLAAMGGSLGAIFGMKIFHHKTRKKAFSLSIPLLLIIHTSLLIVVCK